MKKLDTTMAIAIAAIAGFAIWQGSTSGTKTPATEKSASQSTAGTVVSPTVNLVTEKPPSNVQLWQLGGTSYAKFNEPIDLGNGFFQWGVTKEGSPVVSMNPPESYAFDEWF